MRILVTGAAGFVGSHLCHKLLDLNNEVIGIDNLNDFYSVEQKKNNLSSLENRKNFKFYLKDFTQDLTEVFTDKIDVIAHIGALANVRHSIKVPLEFTHNNVTGTANLLEFAVKYKVNNFILASTGSVYGNNPTPFNEKQTTDLSLSVYAASKKSAELLGHSYHNLYGINFTSCRFFNVYGQRGRPDMMPFRLANAILNQQKIPIFGEGKLLRDWTFIDDIISGLVLVINNPAPYEIYNLGRGEPVLLSDFISILEEYIGKKAIIEHVPTPATELPITYADISKIKNALGYDPKYSVREGLKLFWEWYKDAVSKDLV